MSGQSPAQGLTRPFFSFVGFLVALASLAVFATVGNAARGPSEKEQYAAVLEVAAVMNRSFDKEFADWTQREHFSTSEGPSPTLVYSGKHAQVLVREDATFQRGGIAGGSPLVQSHILAKTEGGRFFTLTYESTLEDLQSITWGFKACDKASCRRMVDFHALTVTQAKNWFFQSKSFSPERYKELFSEEPPPREVKA